MTDPWTRDLHWVRPGQQDRSRKTQVALLEAAAELVAEHGVERTTVAAIAQRAGASVGAVYHHFRDKRAIVYALFDRYCEMMDATVAEAVDPARWSGASIRDVLEGYLAFVLRHGDEASGFRRAGHHLVEVDQAMRERSDRLRLDLDEGLERLLSDRIDEIGHPDPAFAIGLVLDQFSAMIRNRSTQPAGPTRMEKVPDREWVTGMLDSATAYLQLHP
ncbi:MAG: helix-turn-helix domain-containing protein [Actinomycetota bacterium]